MYPKVSVITPTYKRAHFLTRAIDSILNQTYPNVQVVVVDDNALLPEFRAGTQAVMQRYADDPRVLYIQNSSNLGGGGSRNVGIAACDGEYVTFLDDDDEYMPPKIEMQLKFMMMHDLDFSFTDIYMYDKDGKLCEHRTHPYVKDWSVDNLIKLHAVYSLTPTSTYMVKRSFLEEFGGFRNVPMGQEFMLMWDALQYAEQNQNKRFGYIPCAYIKAYLHNEDRISVGRHKVECEEKIYHIKSSKKADLDEHGIRYIDFRHYSVLAVVNLRNKKPGGFMINLLKAFIISPADTFREGSKLLSGKR